jgi:hypothetical protein
MSEQAAESTQRRLQESVGWPEEAVIHNLDMRRRNVTLGMKN